MQGSQGNTAEENGRGRFSPGIRLKLTGFLLPLSFLTIIAVSAAVIRITDGSVRRDLVQRGVSISRVVAFSAGHSLLAGDHLALHALTAETKGSSSDIEYVAIRDTADTVLAHNRIEQRGTPFPAPDHAASLGTYAETRADEVTRGGREMIEFTTPILFAGKRVGTVSLALSRASLLLAQRDIRRSILIAALVFLVAASLGSLLVASFITSPVKKLSSGVNDLANGKSFHPIPLSGGDELGELTRNFNRMAKTILAQQDRLSRYAKEIEEAYLGMVRVIAASIDARDPYTLGHSTRVAQLSLDMGRRLGLQDDELNHLEKACLFHDVGKIRTPDRVLLKVGVLNEEEANVMRRHTADGVEILRMAPSLHRYIPVVLSHHEWYNGMGYPEGRRGSEIPLHAQIIALVDAYDAMTSTRPYRKSRSPEEAVSEIVRCRGTQFSPELTDLFVHMIRETQGVNGLLPRKVVA